MDGICEKLREQRAVWNTKRESNIRAEDRGYLAGLNFAKLCSYETLCDARDVADIILGIYRERGYLPFFILESTYSLGYENKEIDSFFLKNGLECERCPLYHLAEFSERWLLAWSDAILGVCDELEDTRLN